MKIRNPFTVITNLQSIPRNSRRMRVTQGEVPSVRGIVPVQPPLGVGSGQKCYPVGEGVVVIKYLELKNTNVLIWTINVWYCNREDSN